MINIALDGPSGSGKSTIAKELSKKLNIMYLDTGAMYRSFAYFMLKNSIEINQENVENALKLFELNVKYENGVQNNYVNGEWVNEKIRINEVSLATSKVSVFQSVRDYMLKMQRNIAQNFDCVIDGRDVGTKILPDCKNKFFVTASVSERAKRRYEELISKGQLVDYDTIKSEIEERDYRDTHREISPLVQAEDAILVDTTSLNISQVVDLIISKVR